jgi:hypothetical protein
MSTGENIKGQNVVIQAVSDTPISRLLHSDLPKNER